MCWLKIRFSFPAFINSVSIYSLPAIGPPLHFEVDHDPYRHLINNCSNVTKTCISSPPKNSRNIIMKELKTGLSFIQMESCIDYSQVSKSREENKLEIRKFIHSTWFFFLKTLKQSLKDLHDWRDLW